MSFSVLNTCNFRCFCIASQWPSLMILDIARHKFTLFIEFNFQLSLLIYLYIIRSILPLNRQFSMKVENVVFAFVLILKILPTPVKYLVKIPHIFFLPDNKQLHNCFYFCLITALLIYVYLLVCLGYSDNIHYIL